MIFVSLQQNVFFTPLLKQAAKVIEFERSFWANRYLTPFNFFDVRRRSKFTVIIDIIQLLSDHQPKSMTKELIFLAERFPAHQLKIIELYNINLDFRQMCNDYFLSVKMLEAFIKTAPDIKKVQRDYEQVSKDLKKEILHFFENKN